MARKKLGEMLLDAGLLRPDQLSLALADQQRAPAPLGVKLIAMGMVSDTDLLLTLSEQLDAPVAQLDGRRIPPELIDLVPFELAEKYSCMPLFARLSGKTRELFLGMSDPTDVTAVDAIRFRLGCIVRPVLVLHGQLTDAIDRHYRSQTARAGELLARHFEDFAPEIRLADDLEGAGAGAVDLAPSAAPDGAPAGERVFQPVRATDLERPGDPPSGRAVLRALIELLVERGVIGPQDIQQRLQRRRSV